MTLRTSIVILSAMDAMKRVVLRLHRSGVMLLTGSDTTSWMLDEARSATEIAPGSSLLDELEMLQASGIPARDLIVIATLNAARTLGVETRTGSIAGGKDADFLLLDADPGADVGNFRKLKTIYRAGAEISP